MRLQDYLADVMRREFRYGVLDCCTLMADWLMVRGFADPMADRRGRYADYDSYRAAIRSEGGLGKSCARRFAAIGLAETSAPRAGDVCLVRAPLRLRNGRVVLSAAGAICVSERWRAVVTPDAGLVLAPLSVLQAWGASHG